MIFSNKTRKRLGLVEKKVLLLIAAGLSLALTRSPKQYFRILKSAQKEWRKMNQRSLREAIQRLYQSKMIDYKENEDGTITMVLSDRGQQRILKYKLEELKVKKPPRWDRLWRIIVFDIPEDKKQGRDALSLKLKTMGLLSIQKSVFVSPYECRDEVDFAAEIFEVKPYVRYILAKEIDIALDLKNRFKLL